MTYRCPYCHSIFSSSGPPKNDAPVCTYGHPAVAMREWDKAEPPREINGADAAKKGEW